MPSRIRRGQALGGRPHGAIAIRKVSAHSGHDPWREVENKRAAPSSHSTGRVCVWRIERRAAAGSCELGIRGDFEISASIKLPLDASESAFQVGRLSARTASRTTKIEAPASLGLPHRLASA